MKKKVLLSLLFLIILFFSLSFENENNVKEAKINLDESEEVDLKYKSMASTFSYCDELSYGLGSFEASYGSGGGGGGGSSFGSAVAGAVGTALAGVALYGATSQNSTNSSTMVVYPTWTSSTTPSNNPLSSSEKNEDSVLKKLADSILNEESDNFGWTSDELINALKKAMNITKNGELVKVEKLPDEEFKVYLGILIDNSESSYEKVAAKNENGVCFNMSNDKWNVLFNKHTSSTDKYGGMLILNKLFLSYVISKNCTFVLIEDPKYYYDGKKDKILEDRSYSKELQYIWKRDYEWKSSYDMMKVRKGEYK